MSGRMTGMNETFDIQNTLRMPKPVFLCPLMSRKAMSSECEYPLGKIHRIDVFFLSITLVIRDVYSMDLAEWVFLFGSVQFLNIFHIWIGTLNVFWVLSATSRQVYLIIEYLTYPSDRGWYRGTAKRAMAAPIGPSCSKVSGKCPQFWGKSHHLPQNLVQIT